MHLQAHAFETLLVLYITTLWRSFRFMRHNLWLGWKLLFFKPDSKQPKDILCAPKGSYPNSQPLEIDFLAGFTLLITHFSLSLAKNHCKYLILILTSNHCKLYTSYSMSHLYDSYNMSHTVRVYRIFEWYWFTWNIWTVQSIRTFFVNRLPNFW